MGKSSSNNNKSKKVGSADEEVEVAVTAEPQEDELQQEPQEEEQWDVTKVIDQNNEDERCVCRYKDESNKCGGADAVLVWKSTLDPQGDDVWPLCVPCSKADFGVLPEEYKHLDTIADGATEDGDATAIDATGSAAADEDSNKDETAIDTLAPEEEWDLKQIIPKVEIEQFPVQCDEEGCTLLGAVVWTCTKTTPHQKWRACLDCQVIIYFLDFVICF